MGVYIKNMKMPKNCWMCPMRTMHSIFASSHSYCEVLERRFETDEEDAIRENRLDGCPLVEIPTPHGDLIDRDALDARVRQAGGMGNVEEECTEDFNDGVLFVLDYFVKNAPTIIEAKGSEDE